MDNQSSRSGHREPVSHQRRIPQDTRVADNPFFLSGLSSREYLQGPVYDRVISSWQENQSSQQNMGSHCASTVADVLIVLEDAAVTGRSKRSFEELVDQCTALVQSIVAKCYMDHGKSIQEEAPIIEATAGKIINDALTMMRSDIRLDLTSQGFLIKDRGIGIPQFPGEHCIWDDLGLPRETEATGQSWNPNGMSTFFHKLRFSDYRYWDAIYWRTGHLDRQQSKSGYPAADQVGYDFVDQISDAIGRERLDYTELRAKALADHTDKRSLWFLVARRWNMRDHMILVFETNRTRSMDTVDLAHRHDIRADYHSRDPKIAADARVRLSEWVTGRENTIPDMESVLGRPY